MSSKHNRRRSDVTRLLANALLFYRNQSLATAEDLALRVGFDSPSEFHDLQAKLSGRGVIEALTLDALRVFGSASQRQAADNGEPSSVQWQCTIENSESEITS